MEHKWLVTLKRLNNVQDIENGARGLFSRKDVIIDCEEADIDKTIIRDDRFEIVNIQDWNLLQQRQVAQNIQWLFSH